MSRLWYRDKTIKRKKKKSIQDYKAKPEAIKRAKLLKENPPIWWGDFKEYYKKFKVKGDNFRAPIGHVVPLVVNHSYKYIIFSSDEINDNARQFCYEILRYKVFVVNMRNTSSFYGTMDSLVQYRFKKNFTKIRS